MVQIDNKKIGEFIAAIRKDKNMTQKELGDQLFVSDKTVSKWERGLSIPNVVLLIPIAEVLGISVTELLRGEKMNNEQRLEAEEVEGLITGSLDLSVQNTIKQNRKNWMLAYLICFLIVAAEIILLLASGMTWQMLSDNVLLMSGLMLLFALWFCFFTKELLPAYYDENKINYYAQGIFRIHIVGLSFNNGNWPHICLGMKVVLLGNAILYPLLCFVIINTLGMHIWEEVYLFLMLMLVLVMLIVLYYNGKKYE